MSGNSTVELVVTGLLSGGVFAAVGALITSKATARKTRAEAEGLAAKLPAEVDSVVVQGAEQAVLTMKAALDSATARITQLEEEREGDRKRIAELQRQVDALRRKVDTAERALGDARQAGAELTAKVNEFLAEQGRRK